MNRNTRIIATIIAGFVIAFLCPPLALPLFVVALLWGWSQLRK